MKPTKAQICALFATRSLGSCGEFDYDERTLAVCVREGWLEYGDKGFTGERVVRITPAGRAVLEAQKS